MPKSSQEPKPTDDEVRQRILARYGSLFSQKRGSTSTGSSELLDYAKRGPKPAAWLDDAYPFIKKLLGEGETQVNAVKKAKEKFQIGISPNSIRAQYNKERGLRTSYSFAYAVLESDMEASIAAYRELTNHKKHKLGIE